MSVGTGSIKRASKLSTEAATVKNEAEKVVVEAPAKKAPAKKAPAKATTAKAPVKKAPAKVKVKAVKPVNKACRLTEELPIHLL